jgi:hypothetical protein
VEEVIFVSIQRSKDIKKKNKSVTLGTIKAWNLQIDVEEGALCLILNQK